MENHVLRTHSIPATLLQTTPPFQLIVYHLPPPPPGFLYAFTCGPAQAPAISCSEPLLPLAAFPSPNLQQDQRIVPSTTSDSFHTCFPSIPTVASNSSTSEALIARDVASNSVAMTNYPLLVTEPGTLTDQSLASSSFAITNDPLLVTDPGTLTDQSLISLPAPSTGPTVSFNQVEGHSAANTSFLYRRIGHYSSLDAGEPAACTPFWSSKGKGFPRPQFPIEIEKSAQQQQNASTSTQTSMTPDEAIQQLKRFNKTPSFRVRKFVRTNSRMSSVPEATKKESLPESIGSSCYRSPMHADKQPVPQSTGKSRSCYRPPLHADKQLLQYRPRTSKLQHRITEYWRVREKTKEFDEEHKSSPDMKCSNTNVGDLNKLMRGFSFGLKSTETTGVRRRW